MLLTESKIIKNKNVFKLIDKYSYQAKNLYNACNYIIKQASRISYKLSKEETGGKCQTEYKQNIMKTEEVRIQTDSYINYRNAVNLDTGELMPIDFAQWVWF